MTNLDLKQIEEDLVEWNVKLVSVQSILNTLNEEFQEIYSVIQKIKGGQQ